MQILTWLKPRLLGVAGNVKPQVLKLLLAAHQMVKPVLLPEPAAGFQLTMNANRSVVLPRLALADHGFIVLKRAEDMHVVRHHHEVEHPIAITVKVMEAIGHDRG